jgi:Tol biopolymer transport system component
MRARWGTVFLALLALLPSIGARADEATPTAEISVAEQREIEIPDTRIISLSPDGTTVVAGKPSVGVDQLCTYDVATLAERACADLSVLDSGLRIDDVVWSPDGSRIAFSEDAFVRFNDGDIWVMDAATGALTDLTDEGIRGRLPLFNQGDSDVTEFFLDVNPAWSPDRQELAFSRSTWRDGEWRGNEIAVIPVAGGTPRTILQVTPDTPGVVYFGIDWQADGSRLFYNVNYPSTTDPKNGIWVVDVDGQNARQVATATDPDLGPPMVVQVAPAGDRLLAFYIVAATQFAIGGPFYAIVDVASGETTPLTLEEAGAPEHAFVALATLSPNGSKVLYVSRLTDPDNQVFVRDVEGGEAIRLVDGLPRAFTVAPGLIPTWASDGSVLMNSDLDKATLLRIAGSEATPVVATVVPETPPAGTPEPVAGEIATGAKVIVNDDGVRLRAAPSRDAATVLELDRGTELVVIGPSQEADGFVWWPVEEPETRTIGWVRAEFLSLV